MEAKLSKRAQKALAFLREGGEVTYKLERNYFGREQFAVRFYSKYALEKGYGVKVFYELKNAGLLRSYAYSCIGTYYKAA